MAQPSPDGPAWLTRMLLQGGKSVYIETLSLGYKFGRLVWDIWKGLSNSAKALWKRAPYRFVSSLTTLEFVYEGGTQIAYYVQDRTVLFRKPDTALPPFLFETSGKDSVEKLIVEGDERDYSKEQWERNHYVEPVDRLVYEKGQSVRAVLLARSVNGFCNSREDFSVDVRYWMDAMTFVIVFPPQKMPRNLVLVYQERDDQPDVWRDSRWEKYDVRHTTRERLAFYWEEKNPALGRRYKILWDW
ncbi:MAG TPA: hypothetical protein VGS20_02350 [Candidatus Acidoferrales bacterium]|nr:hypothetical protein [Candidatus Acidoferrales bacterium]